ncbi:hypothetical protein [Pedobacter xixiisoli]|uniref:Uncharacterized protein n=1 Tax=Pedobacter xixiisoli TaxID=1476464 RepID=A0A286A7F3_9SPHI|nr:hypothetical protein [Pedobacter xixiisoli]SOD17761.1 hypothetical protein SAMN06297358_2674 [Pedobacter xixiisoli]
MGKPFTSERLQNIRRMRRARRLHKQQPLFAYEMMRTDYPGYPYELFLDDLRYRKPRKKRTRKSGLCRYGRFNRMQSLISQYGWTGDIELARQANKLRERMTKPYRVLAKVEDHYIEQNFSALIPIDSIEELVRKLADCQSMDQANKILLEFQASNNMY